MHLAIYSGHSMIYAEPDQKAKRIAIHIAKLLVKKIVPMFGVPEALIYSYLVVHGTNLLLCLYNARCLQTSY